MTAVDSSLAALALQLARLSASEMDLPVELGRLCEALPSALGVAAAVAMVTEPSDENPVVVASEARAGWIGEAQARSGSGPLPGVVRTGRPLHTPDLTRLGPPELAAAAAETGWTSSMALPLASGRARFGALQLLGTTRRPAHPRDAEAVRVVVDVLVARLVDVRALRMLAVPRPASPSRVDPGDVATVALPAVPAVPPVAVPAARHSVDGAPRRARPAPVSRAVPVPRQAEPRSRHRRREPGDQINIRGGATGIP